MIRSIPALEMLQFFEQMAKVGGSTFLGKETWPEDKWEDGCFGGVLMIAARQLSKLNFSEKVIKEADRTADFFNLTIREDFSKRVCC